MEEKAWNTRRLWSSAKDCLFRNGKDSEEGARDVGDMCPVSPWSLVMTSFTGEETAMIPARAYTEISIIIIINSYSLYKVVSVREEFWFSQWFASHARAVIRGVYDNRGHFHCYIVR